MGWQDTAMTVGSIIFIVALLPTVFSQNKPPISTSLITGFTLGIFAVSFGSLDLWYSCITESIVAILWLVIAAQVIHRNHRNVAQDCEVSYIDHPDTKDVFGVEPGREDLRNFSPVH